MTFKHQDIKAVFPSLSIQGPEEMERLGGILAKHIYPGLLLLLSGDLGAGKTFLTRSIGTALGVRGVKSPTFAIEAVHPLPGKTFAIVHVDLYRLDDISDALLQIEERLLDGDTVVVEWGERWPAPPHEDVWQIEIKPQDNPDARIVDLSASGLKALRTLSDAYGEML